MTDSDAARHAAVVWRYALGSVSSALLRVAACSVAVLGPETAR